MNTNVYFALMHRKRGKKVEKYYMYLGWDTPEEIEKVAKEAGILEDYKIIHWFVVPAWKYFLYVFSFFNKPSGKYGRKEEN